MTDGDLAWKHQIPPWADSWAVGKDEVIVTQINHLALLTTSNTYKFQQANLPIRFEQLQREEAAQRERADAAEKYKVQLENFIDMICHEIRNP